MNEDVDPISHEYDSPTPAADMVCAFLHVLPLLERRKLIVEETNSHVAKRL